MKYYCSECGNEVRENEVFCSNCGNKSIIKSPIKKEKNGLSIGGLVLSILGLLTCGLLTPISLIINIVNIVISKKKNNKDKLAMAGLIITIIQIVIFVVGFIFLANAETDIAQDYSGRSYSELLEYCKDKNNKCIVEEEYSDTVPKGEFVRQVPNAGEEKFAFKKRRQERSLQNFRN